MALTDLEKDDKLHFIPQFRPVKDTRQFTLAKQGAKTAFKVL